jgi:PHD/YefM family antitoxin component YafN of YafNO toxin-antitoxin module
MKLISAREFNQDVSLAKRLANFEPVFITDRGTPTHVLVSIDNYVRLTGQTETIVDLLATPEITDSELDFARSAKAWDREESAA